MGFLVKANTHKYERGITNINGEYQCTVEYTTSNNLHFTIDWDHSDFFLIKNERLAQYITIRYLSNIVDVFIPENIHATIFRAAQFFADNKGLHKLRATFGYPGTKQMRIYDHTDWDMDDAGSFLTNESKTRIHIYKTNGVGFLPYFQTTIHELGHGNMCRNKGKYKYADTGSMIKESWASFVEWYMTPMAYRLWGHPNPAELGRNRQSWEKIYNDYYSPLFIDLMDDHNQYAAKGNNPNYPNDRIKNVPATVIESIACNSYSCKSFEKRGQRVYRQSLLYGRGF